MKHLILTTIAALVLVGCIGVSQPLEPPTTRVLDVPILAAAYNGNIEAVKQHLPAGANVNAA